MGLIFLFVAGLKVNYCRLSFANLRGADVTGAYTTKTNFCGAIIPDSQKISEGCPKSTK